MQKVMIRIVKHLLYYSIIKSRDVYEYVDDELTQTSVSWTNIINIMSRVREKYNVIITNITYDQRGTITGFIHPITNQLYSFQEAYSERKEMCDLLFTHSNLDVFRWKVRSVSQMSLLAAEHLYLICICIYIYIY